MRRRYRWMCLMLGWGLAVSPVAAQSYSQLWEKVETLQKEDLPQSQLKVLGEICRNAGIYTGGTDPRQYSGGA